MFFIAFVLLFSSAFSSNVMVLDSSNFDSVVGHEKGVFVKFYAPWCGHCKALAPDYEVVGDVFSKIDKVVVAEVDADADRTLGSRFGIKGFPTLKWFPANSVEPIDYNGGRTTDDIVNYINQNVGTKAGISKPPSAVLSLGTDDFDLMVQNKEKNVLVKFFAPWCGHCKRMAPEFEAAAFSFFGDKDVVFAEVDCTVHRELAEKYGISGYPTLKYFPTTNKDGEDYLGGRETDDFIKFFNNKVGTDRKVGGGFLPEAARTVETDEKVKLFMSASPEEREGIISDTDKLIDIYDGRYKSVMKFYPSIMKKIIEKGEGYIEKEKSRLERMYDSASLTQDKRAAFAQRINILTAFQE